MVEFGKNSIPNYRLLSINVQFQLVNILSNLKALKIFL